MAEEMMNDEMLQTTWFDAADYLHDDNDIMKYLEIVASENDPQAFCKP